MEKKKKTSKSTLNTHQKDWYWISNTLAPDAMSWLIGKDPDVWKDLRQKEKREAEDEVVG